MDAAEFATLAVANLRPDPANPRRTFDRDYLDRLADSVAAFGVRVPLIVRPDPDGPAGTHVIVDGACRLRAAKAAGLAEVPCLVVPGDADEADLLAVQVTTNEVREGLTVFDRADAFQRLMRLRGWGQAELGERCGLSQGSISKALSVKRVVPDLRCHFEGPEPELPASIALMTAALKTADRQREFVAAVRQGGLKRDAARRLADRMRGKKAAEPRRPVTVRLACGVVVTVPPAVADDHGRLAAELDALKHAVNKAKREGLPLDDVRHLLKPRPQKGGGPPGPDAA